MVHHTTEMPRLKTSVAKKSVQKKRSLSGQNDSMKQRIPSAQSVDTPEPKKRKKGSTSVDTTVRGVQVGSRSYTTWQQPESSTIDFVMNIIDSNILCTLSSVGNEDFDEVQNVIQQLRNKLKTRFMKAKVPKVKSNNYQSHPKVIEWLNESIEWNLDQVDLVEEECSKLEMLSKAAEEELEQLQQSTSQPFEDSPPSAQQKATDENANELLIKSLQAIISSMEAEET